MKYLAYKSEELLLEGVRMRDIADSVGTPFYCYSKKTLQENYQKFAENFKETDHKICYAIKANSNLHLVKILCELGSGVDAVSAGEIYKAIRAGIDPKKIVFAGVGKTKSEMEFALNCGVEEFSVESKNEMFALSEVATRLGLMAKFSARINPDVDAKTHSKISTGRKCDKFGINIDDALEIYGVAKSLPSLDIYGISTHIGSQIASIEPFELAFAKVRELCILLRKNGHNIQSLDFGGGIGIFYKDENIFFIEDYAKMVKKITSELGVKLTLAPGRAIVGSAGILISKITYLKESGEKKFAIIDAGMNDLARPGLYGSYHEALQVKKKYGEKTLFDLVGPVCESTDVLAKNREFVDLKQGDLLAILSAGAYGSSMSSEYNCRPLIPEILVDNNQFEVIRRRPSFEEMISLEAK
jgi:diaminopimelate decarboxylase